MDNNSDKPVSKENNIPGQNAAAIEKLKQKHAEEKVVEAHEQADADMEQDAELTATSPNDDLDEGETARLGDDDKLPI